MILHIFKHDKFTESFIDEINSNFNMEQHKFIVVDIIESIDIDKIKQYSNVIIVNGSQEVISEIKAEKREIDKIFVHCLFFGIKLFTFFLINRKLLKRTYWVEWGSDLYQYRYASKYSINEKLRKLFIKNIKGIVTYISGEYNLIKKLYKTKANLYYAFYPYLVDENMINNMNKKEKDKSLITIQIGNSADPSNCHEEILNVLEKYKNENIRIYCPLSYGQNEHKDKVENIGKDKFGEKFIAVKEFLPLEKYIDILNEVDIAIFNNDRQQAMGNILTLLAMGKKVYIRNDISTWDFLIENKVKIYNVSDFEKNNYFLEVNDSYIAIENNKIILNMFSKEAFYKAWKNIFEEDNG